MIFVELDFETRSLCNLKEAGAERYSEDESTDIICLCFSFNDRNCTWTPGYPTDVLYELAKNPTIIFVAHNAAFEQAIWRNIMVPIYGFPPVPIERWACTLAACAYKGYPLALDKAGKALRLEMNKDKEGNQLTLSMSGIGAQASRLFKRTGNLPELTPQIRQRIIQYCQQDVVVENGIMKRIGLLRGAEKKIWTFDQRINQRGVRLDMGYVEAAQVVVDRASAPLREEFTASTGLTKVGSPRLLEWCASNGTKLDNLQKKTLAKALEIEDEETDPDYGYESLAGDDDEQVWQEIYSRLQPNVRRALEIRCLLAGAAIKKLKRMRQCVGYDGRARGLLQYHAAHSGRWGGRLLQPQNFPRESVKGLSPDDVVSAILSRDPRVVERETGLPALEAVARSLRHALIPDPGKIFLVGDYKSIEAVVILALAGHIDLANQLAGGLPIYMRMAETIFGKAPGTWAVEDKVLYKHYKEVEFVQEYTAGKATILGCGFQMAPPKFKATALRQYGIELTDKQSEDAVYGYRDEVAPKVPKVWYGLQEAALAAMETGRPREAYGVTYEPSNGWMIAHLPNGWQKLYYPQPRLSISKFGKPAWQYMRARQNAWVPVDMYGGLEAENVVQALARGQLCGAIERLENANMPVVLTTHDECISEVDIDSADLLKFTRTMEARSKWVEDLQIPIAVESQIMTRYKK